MSDVKISKPRLRVVIEAGEDLVEYEVQTDNRDAVGFDIMRARRNWPGGDVAPMLWMTCQAWSALKRSGVEPWCLGDKAGGGLDAFIEVCVDLTPIKKDGTAITSEDDMAGELAVPFAPAIASA